MMSKKETVFCREKAAVSYFCDNWLFMNSSRLKRSSFVKYSAEIENHIKPFFGQRRPCEIVPEEIHTFSRMLAEEKKLSPRTVHSILVLLHSILAYIKKCQGESFMEPEIIYPKTKRQSVRVLSEREELLLTEFLFQGMESCKFGIYLALRTGMRIGEICALRWCDISLESSAISVCHTVQRLPQEDGPERSGRGKPVVDKGGIKTSLMLGTPKSDSSMRIIPLMEDIEILCRKFSYREPSAFILTGTEQCMDPRKLQRRLGKCTEACGMEGVHFHTLRHTFATRCIEAGFDMKTLSEILGHSNVATTMNLYVHPSLELKRENMSRLKVMAFPF